MLIFYIRTAFLSIKKCTVFYLWKIQFNIRIFYLHTILPLLAIALICGGIVWGVTVLLPDGLLRLLLTTPLAIVSVVLLAYYVVLDESTRKVCISIVKNRILERFSNLLWFNSKLRR